MATDTLERAGVYFGTGSGEVYASEAFAALVKVHGVTEFRCQYVKQLQLAKTYGSGDTAVAALRGVDPALSMAKARIGWTVLKKKLG